MPQRFVFTGERQVILEDFAVPAASELKDNQVRVRGLGSLLSTGTETIVYARRFEPNTGWDRWVKYPFYPGYSMIGEVEATGPAVKKLKKGDRVGLRNPHASHHIATEDKCVPVPKTLDLKQAAWFALAKICFMGARAAEYHLGDSVLIVGAGPIGQMSVRWARAAGAETIVVLDRIEGRLAAARQGGATHTFAKPVGDALADVQAACHGELPRVVMDSTGSSPAFAQSLACARQYGTLIIMGDTGTPSEQHLTHDVMLKGLTIRGAHDSHETAEWNLQSICRKFFNLVETKRFSLEGLTTHTFKPNQCKELYDTACDKRDATMGIYVDWS
ncbi:MAG TPA: zinc-binding alcohol dehydrogenase [Planctomycetota bacterium]|nr:zinc-binding alcohol dehydrogenase [Planctomycetota bacterium]